MGNDALSDEQREIRALVRTLARERIAPRAGEIDASAEFPHDMVELFREHEILALMAQHRTNVEIAERLGLSQKTVRNHVSNIFGKLQVADRAEAIIRARRVGLGVGPDEVG